MACGTQASDLPRPLLKLVGEPARPVLRQDIALVMFDENLLRPVS
jgi:hypothetical protein